MTKHILASTANSNTRWYKEGPADDVDTTPWTPNVMNNRSINLRRGWSSGRYMCWVVPRTRAGVLALNICVAKKTLSEVPGPEETLLLCPSSLEGSLLLTRAETILPAFWIRSKTFRMILGPATLEETAPHLLIHRIQQRLHFLILHLPNLHQLSHNLLSRLKGPRWHALSSGEARQLPYSSPSLPTVVPSSRCLRDAFAMLSLEVLCPWSFPTVPGASLLSLELPRLPRSLAVFRGVPQSSPEFPSLCRSSSLSARVAATSSEPLSLGVLRRFFAKLPLSSESFPVVSYDAAIAS